MEGARRDLFTAARVDRRKDKIDGRKTTVDDWVRVFNAKRDEIVKRRLRWDLKWKEGSEALPGTPVRAPGSLVKISREGREAAG